MHRIVSWLEATFRALPLPLLETWGEFAYLIGLALALLAFGGFSLRCGTRWTLSRERQAWDGRAFLSVPLTFVLILATGYVGSAIVLVPGAQTFESLKDLCVFACILLFGYPALITVPFAYGLSDLIEGVPPDFLWDWLSGYFINPSCFWVAYQLFGKDPDFRRPATWSRYLAFVLIFMTLEPQLWGHICSDKFTAEISYHNITPALFFTTSITWLLAPFAMLAALPLARRAGLFWAEIDGHVQERALGNPGDTWTAGSAQRAATGVPIRMFLLLPFIALVLVMVATTAYVTLHSAESEAQRLAARLHQSISENLKLRLDDYLSANPPRDEAELVTELSAILRTLEVAKHGRVFIVDRVAHTVAPPDDDDPIKNAAIAELLRISPNPRALRRDLEFRFAYVSEKPLSHETWFARASVYARPRAQADWILITALPESFYLAGVQAGNSRSAVVFALALLSSLAVAALLASVMTAPLRRVVSATRAVASGDLGQRVPETKLEELAVVARAFNDMAEQLKSSFDALVREVETRKRREHELEESEARLLASESRMRLATSAGRLGVWDWDVANNRLIWDDSMYELYGLHKEQFGGAYEAWASCLAAEDAERVTGEVDAALSGERPFASEFRVRRPDGSERTIRAVSQTLRDEHGRAKRMVGVNWDVTERYLAERELRRHRDHLEELVRERTLALHQAKEQADAANRAKSAFLANMSHEIRTPMNAILGFAQLMERQPDMSLRARDRLARITSSGRHLLELINSVLEMSKIEAGRTTLRCEPFDPRGLLEGVRLMFADLIQAKGVEIALQPSPQLPAALEGDAGKVRQVLINLLGNAAKFTSRGRITIAAAASLVREGVYAVTIEVRDTGVGIEPHELRRIFDAFDQAERGSEAGGTGLGLAISRSFARVMGGDLTVESAAGSGSCFRFTFEARACTHALPAADERSVVIDLEPGTRQRRQRVLVVDDEPVNRELMQDLLSQLGFDARTAQSADDALELAVLFQPELILMDLRMPEVDGFEAIRRLRASGSHAKIIAFTASVAPEFEHTALEAGADLFLRKPYRERELLIAIADALQLSYRLSTEPVAAQELMQPREAIGQLLAQLPEALRAELREATLEARVERIEQIAGRAVEHSAAAAEQIRALARRYDYDTLLSALELPRAS